MSAVLIALIVLLIGAGAFAWALAVIRRSRLALERRVHLVFSQSEALASTPASQSRAALLIARLDANVRRAFTFGLKRTWGMRMGSLTLFFVACGAGATAWLLTYKFFDFAMPISAVLSVCAMFLAPRYVLSWQQKRIERQFSDLFPDAVDTIARMLRAGLPVSQAILAVATAAAPPVNQVFSAIADQLRIGVPLEEAIDASSRQIGSADFRFFAVAIVLQYSTGGNLTSTLEIISEIIRRRRATRQKAKAATGEIRITAYTLGSLPFLATGALLVI